MYQGSADHFFDSTGIVAKPTAMAGSFPDNETPEQKGTLCKREGRTYHELSEQKTCFAEGCEKANYENWSCRRSRQRRMYQIIPISTTQPAPIRIAAANGKPGAEAAFAGGGMVFVEVTGANVRAGVVITDFWCADICAAAPGLSVAMVTTGDALGETLPVDGPATLCVTAKYENPGVAAAKYQAFLSRYWYVVGNSVHTASWYRIRTTCVGVSPWAESQASETANVSVPGPIAEGLTATGSIWKTPATVRPSGPPEVPVFETISSVVPSVFTGSMLTASIAQGDIMPPAFIG